MFSFTLHSPAKVLLLTSAALSLAACGSSGSYRVASVGSVGQTGGTGQNGTDGAGGPSGSNGATGPSGSNGSNGGTGSTGGNGTNGMNGMNGMNGTSTAATQLPGRVLVTAGNTLIGVSGKHNELAETINGLAPGTTQITGTVTTVLRKSGQSLVDLGNGQSLILNGAGGKLGEVVNINLLSRTVTGATSGSRLLGVSVLSPRVATGSLAAVNVGNNGQLLTVGNGSAATGALAPVTGVLAPVTGASGVLAPVTGVVGGVTGGTGSVGTTGHLTGVVGGVVGGLTGTPHP